MVGFDRDLTSAANFRNSSWSKATSGKRTNLHGADAIGRDLPRCRSAQGSRDRQCESTDDARARPVRGGPHRAVLSSAYSSSIVAISSPGRGSNSLYVSISWPNGVLSGHALGSNHLLDLVPDGLAILEQQGHMFATAEPAPFLLGDDQWAQPRTQNLNIARRAGFL